MEQLISGYIVRSLIDNIEAIVSVCPALEQTELEKNQATKFVRTHTVLAIITKLPTEDEFDFRIRLNEERKLWQKK